MGKHLLAAAAVIAALALSSCKQNVLTGRGNKITITPAVTTFTAIGIEIPIKTVINITPGAPTVSFSGYENLIKHMKATVENNKLTIHYDLDDTWTIHGDGVTATINVPSIASLALTGAPDAIVHGSITGPDFKLEISGASDIDIDSINADNFTANVSGAADIKIKGGSVQRATYTISGAGDIKAFNLQALETAASISGAGDGEVSARNKLTASISGAGEIKYKGHPVITRNISGVGEVTDAN